MFFLLDIQLLKSHMPKVGMHNAEKCLNLTPKMFITQSIFKEIASNFQATYIITIHIINNLQTQLSLDIFLISEA